jgi:hypothetical protein
MAGRTTDMQEFDRTSLIDTWQVVVSPDFDDDVLHSEGTPFIALRQEGGRVVGTYQIGLQGGDLDGRLQGDGSALLTFEGTDEMDPVNGAATARLDGDRMIFTLMYHQGDDYTFECERQL